MMNYTFYPGQRPDGIKFNRAHAMLVMNDGRVLLRYKDGEARVTGGRIEEGEDPIETLRREIMEEIDCEIDRCDYLGYVEAYNPENNLHENFARLVARVSKILPARPDPDRSGNWIYGRVLVPAEIAHREMDGTFPTNRAVLDCALKVAQEQGYFTGLPSDKYKVINVESHDESA